jgi:hypothetical protein
MRKSNKIKHIEYYEERAAISRNREEIRKVGKWSLQNKT